MLSTLSFVAWQLKAINGFYDYKDSGIIVHVEVVITPFEKEMCWDIWYPPNYIQLWLLLLIPTGYIRKERNTN